MSLLSYSKVPSTPITGVNFYDVFGQVGKVESGKSSAKSSSGDEIPNEEGLEGMKLECSHSHCEKCKVVFPSGESLNPDISFLQEKQAEILADLHKEIRTLKSENADLKYQVHVILCQPQPHLLKELGTLKDTRGTASRRETEKSLELQLESATKMIAELKWVQQHYEKKIKMQEDRIEELMRKQMSLDDDVGNNYNEQLDSSTCNRESSGRYSKSGSRRSQTPTMREAGIRRNSVQSILPENYREQVATLPPIKNMGANATSPLFPPLPLLKPKSLHKSAKTNQSKMKNRPLLYNLPDSIPPTSTKLFSIDLDQGNGTRDS